MAAREKDDTTNFLSRWSQRKRAAEEAALEPVEPVSPPAGETAAAGEESAVDLTDLPEIDTLEPGSDFTVFMRKGVPEELKRRALRRLWQVDPAFHHICMLDDYNLDYTDAATVVPNLKTIYQVGRGMVLPEDDAPEAQAAEAAEDAASLPAPPASEESEAPPQGRDTIAAEPQARAVRKPGTPLVSPPPNRAVADAEMPRRAQPGAASREGASSARRRRWGDTDS